MLSATNAYWLLALQEKLEAQQKKRDERNAKDAARRAAKREKGAKKGQANGTADATSDTVGAAGATFDVEDGPVRFHLNWQ